MARRGAPQRRAPAERTNHSTRLFAIVARQARSAVVFRRGPSKQVQMLLWDLARDVLTPGQWLSGRIYNERCDLSPDGRLVVYFAGKFKGELGTFTAISRPPYFTALAVWPDGSTWGGGGFFEGNRRLILNYGRVLDALHAHQGVPTDFEISHLVEYRAHHPEGEVAATNGGWHLIARGVDGEPTASMRVAFAEPWIYEKPHPLLPWLALEKRWIGMFKVEGPACVYCYRLIERPRRGRDAPVFEELGPLDWADWDHDGSLLYSESGCLFRRNAMPRGARAPCVQVADLRGHVFKNVIPPDEARRWP